MMGVPLSTPRHTIAETNRYSGSSAFAERSLNKQKRAAERVALFIYKSFLDPAVTGVFPEKLVEVLTRDGMLWDATADEMKTIKKSGRWFREVAAQNGF